MSYFRPTLKPILNGHLQKLHKPKHLKQFQTEADVFYINLLSIQR